MKKLIHILFFCSLMLTVRSQNVGVEKSVLGIQAGFLGIWINHETRLSESVAFRTEAGLDGGLWGGAANNGTAFYVSPVFAAEPRWYYNLRQREKSKKTVGNSADFISLRTSYRPDGFHLSSRDNVQVVSDMTLVPTWGIRRHLGDHFHYETSAGFGYRYIFWDRTGLRSNESDAIPYIHLRVGYTF